MSSAPQTSTGATFSISGTGPSATWLPTTPTDSATIASFAGVLGLPHARAQFSRMCQTDIQCRENTEYTVAWKLEGEALILTGNVEVSGKVVGEAVGK
jgi:hypothetical protein